MASQVLSGSSDVSYTNNTGQNVRIVINYMSAVFSGVNNAFITLNWAGVSATSRGEIVIGRNLAFQANSGLDSLTGNNGKFPRDGGALPTELMLAPGQRFSTSGVGAYNVVVIPEAG